MTEKIQDGALSREVMLMAFWDCWGLIYTKFGTDACKMKTATMKEMYFDTLYCMTCHQGVEMQAALVHSVPSPRQCRSTLQKTDQESHRQPKWEEFIHPPYILDLEPCDYHMFPQLTK